MTQRKLARFLAFIAIVATSSAALAASPSSSGEMSTPTSQADPLDSPRWADMQKLFFADAEVVFDPRVRVTAPNIAEDSMNVPVTVDATDLTDVKDVLVFADFNPIIKVLSFQPGDAHASLGFRLKLQQSSPVRAAARTQDGVWHVGGTWITATGGGCTQPSTGSSSAEWQDNLNQVSGRIWTRVDGGERVRLRVIHPMDTGLAPGIPVFHIEEMVLASSKGDTLMQIQPFEPVSEDPSFTIDLPPSSGRDGRVRVTGRDNNGNQIDAWVSK